MSATTKAGITLAIFALAGTPGPTVGQAPPPAPPTPAAQEEDLRRHVARLDSIRAEIQRVSEEQMEAIRRISESRQTEMDALRQGLNAQSRSLQAAQLQLVEAERRITDVQRGEIEEVRARMLEESRRLSTAAAELARMQGARSLTPPAAPSRVVDLQSRALEQLQALTYLPGSASAQRMIPLASLQYNMFSVGSRAIGGAVLTSMTPSLARYFGVEAGVLITDVTEGSQAAQSGLQGGDVIVAINGEPVETENELRSVLSIPVFTAIRGTPGPAVVTPRPLEPIRLRIVRDRESMEIEMAR